jgi:hypothetical protein
MERLRTTARLECRQAHSTAVRAAADPDERRSATACLGFRMDAGASTVDSPARDDPIDPRDDAA